MSGRSRSKPKMSHNCGQRHEGHMTWSHDMVTFKMITFLVGVQGRATKYYEMGRGVSKNPKIA